METTAPDPTTIGHRLRVAIKMLAAGKGMSIPELGRRSGIGGQKLSDRIEEGRNRVPTRLSIEEAAAIADVLGIGLSELVQVAETGRGLALSTHRKLRAIDGGGRPGKSAPRTPLLALVDRLE
jgi:hypothetical protein